MKLTNGLTLIEQLDKLADNENQPPQVLQQKLDAHNGWPLDDKSHCLTRKDLLALMAGLGAKRPVLITGEPGCGKSHTARAYASLLGFAFIGAMIKPGSSHESLLWSIDHVKRLSTGQAFGTKGELPDGRLDVSEFQSKGAVWQAFDSVCSQGTVLLLDEVDKADLSLVNGLLDVLDQGSFTGPEGECIKCRTEHPLLVVLTSNGDRPMPPAVIRRCAQHSIELPENEDEFQQHLIKLGEIKFADLQGKSVLKEAAKHIAANRDPQLKVRPGISEYVDLLRTWVWIQAQEGEDKANNYLHDLHAFFLKKAR